MPYYKVRLVKHNKEGHRIGKYKTVKARSPEEAATMVGKGGYTPVGKAKKTPADEYVDEFWKGF